MSRARLSLCLLYLCACKEPSENVTPVAVPALAPVPPAPVTPPSLPPAAVAQNTAPPAPAAPVPTDAIDGFAGFSGDGKSFAWILPSPTLPELRYWKTITEGQTSPPGTTLERDAAGLAQGRALIKKGGFTSDRKAAPADVTLDLDLTVKPPRLALVRAGRKVPVNIGPDPYPPSDSAEIWGVSADGKRAAIHIHGPDVPGLLSKGTGGTFHFFFIAQVP